MSRRTSRRPRVSAAARWRRDVRAAEIENPIGLTPMTADEPFGAHDDSRRFAESVVRVSRAGAPAIAGIVQATADRGRTLLLRVLDGQNEVRIEKFSGREVTIVVRQVEREKDERRQWSPMRTAETRAQDRPAHWQGARAISPLREGAFAKARRVWEYRRVGGVPVATATTGWAVLKEAQRRWRLHEPPYAHLRYHGGSRYVLRYDLNHWVEFESDPP